MLNALKPAVEGSVHANGFDIHYEYFGNRDRPAAVIFNGVAMDAKSWYRFIPMLFDRMDVLLWDYPGQGESTSTDVPYRVEDWADAVVAIINTLGLKKEHVNLLGVSTGSLVVAEVLRRYQGIAHRAVLSGVMLEPAMSFKLDSDFGIRMLRENRVDLWAQGLYTKILSDGFLMQLGPGVLGMQAALVERFKNKAHALARIIEAQSNYLWNSEQYRSGFEEINTPILILAGAEDKLVPPFYQERVSAMLLNAEYKEYPRCAHIPFFEQAEQTFADCAEFFLGK